MAKAKFTTAAQIDLYDLARKLRQMKAAINAISGGGFESFKAVLEAYLVVALTFSNAMKTFDGTPASALGVSVAAMEYAQAYVALEGGPAKIAGEMQ